MAKQKALKIHLNNTFDEKGFKVKEGVIFDGNDRVGYNPLCVLTENKPKRVFWRGAKTLILFVEGALNALRFMEATDKLQTYWSKDEASAFVEKMVALAGVEVKPLKTWQFLVIMLLLGIAIVIGALNLQKLGAIGL